MAAENMAEAKAKGAAAAEAEAAVEATKEKAMDKALGGGRIRARGVVREPPRLLTVQPLTLQMRHGTSRASIKAKAVAPRHRARLAAPRHRALLARLIWVMAAVRKPPRAVTPGRRRSVIMTRFTEGLEMTGTSTNPFPCGQEL